MSRTSLPYPWKADEPLDHKRLNENQARTLYNIHVRPPLFATRFGNQITIHLGGWEGGGGDLELPVFQYVGMGWFMVANAQGAGAYPFSVQPVI